MVDEHQEHEAHRISRRPTHYARTARHLTHLAGSLRYVLALGFVLAVWTVVGALAHFPRWWELVITVGMPFATLAILALAQHTQNHDSSAIELKLDELISALDGPSNAMLRVEEGSEGDLDRLREHFGAKLP